MTDDLKARGVRVKALEWGPNFPPNAHCSYDHCIASGGAWTYQVEWKSWKDHPGFCIDRDGVFVTSEETLEAAKAAAQADYESRILSALEISDE